MNDIFIFISSTFYGKIIHLNGMCLQCDEVDPSDVIKVVKTVKRALATYGTQALKEMIQNCMAQDFSWKVSSSCRKLVLHMVDNVANLEF